MARAELGEHIVEFWRRATWKQVQDDVIGTAFLQANFATAGTKSWSFDRDISEQGLNSPRLVIVDRAPSAAFNASLIAQDHLIDLILDDPRLQLLKWPCPRTISSQVAITGPVEIANDRHELGHFQSLALGVDRLQPAPSTL